MNNVRDLKLFYKKFYKLLVWQIIIGKWKNDLMMGLNENQ